MEREITDQSVLLDYSPEAPAGSTGRSQSETAEELNWSWSEGIALDIARATRTWIQYGMLGFAVACIVIGAVKGLLGL